MHMDSSHDDNAYEPAVLPIPFPADFADEKDADVLARASTLCATAEEILKRMVESNQTPTIDEDEKVIARQIFDEGPSRIPATQNMPTGIALHLTALLSSYDLTVVQSAQQIRNLCTNLLIEKAVKGKTEQVQLRAVEMLGKIKDVGLFEERSTVLVEHLTTDELKTKLKEKIGRLKHLATEAVDVIPTPDLNPTDAAPDLPLPPSAASEET